MKSDKEIWDTFSTDWKTIIFQNIYVQNNMDKLPDFSFWKGYAVNFNEFDISNENLSNFRLQEFPKKLDIFSTPIKSLEPLKDTNNLEEFYCGDTAIRDLSPLIRNSNLKKLCCYNTPLTDIHPLQYLKNLKRLCLSRTGVSDINEISVLVNLEKLALYRTFVEDISPLKTLTKLQKLNINFTPVKNLSPLFGLKELKELHCFETNVLPDQIAGFKLINPDCKVINEYEQPETEYDDFK